MNYDFIQLLCRLYVSIEDAIQLVRTLGVCYYTAKTDIKKCLGLPPFAQSTTASSVSNGIVSSILISASPWSVHLCAKSSRQLFSGQPKYGMQHKTYILDDFPPISQEMSKQLVKFFRHLEIWPLHCCKLHGV